MQTFASIRKITDAADTLKNFTVPAGAGLHKFGPKNLIYGYNGSGKTTISRIFAYISLGERPDGLGENFEFEFELDGGGTLTRTSDLTPYASHVLVYNEDYIERNFAWNTGTAQPIFGLGERNIADVEALNAARAQRNKVSDELTQAKRQQQTARKTLDTFCRDTARTIEQRVYQGRSFNAAKLKARCNAADFDPSQSLTDEALEQAERELYT